MSFQKGPISVDMFFPACSISPYSWGLTFLAGSEYGESESALKNSQNNWQSLVFENRSLKEADKHKFPYVLDWFQDFRPGNLFLESMLDVEKCQILHPEAKLRKTYLR